MEATAKLIAEDIDSGKYFAEARQWYNKIYLQPLSETSILVTIVTILLAVFLITSYNLYSVFPRVRQVNTMVFLPSTLYVYPTIKNIAQAGKTTKQVVAEYLCGKYIQARESYDYSTLIYNYNFIFRSSTKPLFDSYYQNLIISNPSSPIVLYKDTQIITTAINNTVVDLNTGTATVRFTTTLYDHQSKIISTNQWVATIGFYLDNYDFSKSINSQLNFIVTKYNVTLATT
jgi:type IV secretion system protein VirB8